MIQRIVILHTFADAMKMQRRLRAAAQHSSSGLSSAFSDLKVLTPKGMSVASHSECGLAFTLYHSCNVNQQLPVINETHTRDLLHEYQHKN